MTVDVKAAIGSNLYFDEIRQNGSWISQKTKNTIRVVTTRKGPADETGARETMTIVARRLQTAALAEGAAQRRVRGPRRSWRHGACDGLSAALYFACGARSKVT